MTVLKKSKQDFVLKVEINWKELKRKQNDEIKKEM